MKQKQFSKGTFAGFFLSFFCQFLSVIFMQLVLSNYRTPSFSFDRGLWFLGSLWLINFTSTATKHLVSVRVRLNGPDKHD